MIMKMYANDRNIAMIIYHQGKNSKICRKKTKRRDSGRTVVAEYRLKPHFVYSILSSTSHPLLSDERIQDISDLIVAPEKSLLNPC